jgi:3-dehydrosphinganine reductase
MPVHALVTGGSSGIGRALARRLAVRGYDISMIARRQSPLEETAAELKGLFRDKSQQVFWHAADVSEAAQAEEAVAAAVARLGAPDLVVTSAGIAVPGYFEDIGLDVFERSMAVNYFGSLYIARAALPGMRRQRRGRLVFVSSGAALMGIFGYTTYCPTKFALRGLAETLRAELRADGVGVSIVYPPDTQTPMLDEENKTKPEETKRITGIVKTWTADAVADSIIRGIARGAFAITPGLAITLMNRMPGAVVPLLTWYGDHLAAGVRRERARTNQPRTETRPA